MKTVCIYHRVDLDGWMSAAIVKDYWINTGNWAGDSLDFIGYNYGDAIPDLSEYKRVVMVDISFPIEEMKKLYHPLNFIWIDHHISAIKDNIHSNHIIDGEDVSKYIYAGIRNVNFAACELTWKYFFPFEEIPEIVRLLGMYDSFRHKGTEEEEKVLEFQYGARSFITDYETAYKELTDTESDTASHGAPMNNVLRIRLRGKSIYQYLCTEAKQIYDTGFRIYIKNSISGEVYQFMAINKERFNPMNFNVDYNKDGCEGVLCFWYADKSWNFSLYSNMVDCTKIAENFIYEGQRGGGHKGAAGFRCSNKDFNNIMILDKPDEV